MANNIKAKDVIKGVFSSYAPTTINTVDSAREVASDVRTIGRRINTGMRQNMAQIDKSQPGRRAIALFAAAKDALTSGDYEIEQANDDMYDDYEEYEANFTTANMTDDERANTSPEEVILRGNKGVAQSVIRASTAQLSGMNAASRKILSGTLKGMEASTKSINATIMYGTNVMTTQLGMVNNKLDAINKNLVTLIEYQNDNTTTYYEKNLELMSTMLKSMENLNTMSQGKGARDLKNFNTRGGFNIKEYVNRVKKGIKNSAMVSGAGMLGSIYKMSIDNPDIMSPGETIGQMLSMVLGSNNKIGGKLNTVAKFDKRIQQYMDEALYQVGDKLGTNLIASLFGLDSLGNKRRTIGGVGLSNYMKDQLPWNGKAQKALTEVIPELLTSIDAGVNKSDKRYFDFDEGTWKNRKEIASNFASQINNNITLEMQNLTDTIAKKLEASGKSADEISSVKKQLSDKVTDRIYGEGDLKTLRTDTAEILKNMNLSNEQAASVFNSLENAITNVTESISEMYARIGSTDSIYRNINNRSGATASESIGTEAYKELRRNRNETNIFGLTFSQDVESVIKYVEKRMKEEYPNFRMTKEYQDAILAAVRSGASDSSILRSISNVYGRNEAGNKVFGKVKKFVYGAVGKEYKPEEVKIQEDEFDNFGTRGNAINYELMKKVYGVDFSTPKAQPQKKSKSRTVQPQQNKVGAASSRGSNDAGKVAGAGTNAVTQGKAEGKSSTIPVDTQRDKARDELVDAAMDDFNDAMNATESNLQQDETARANGAKMVEDIAKEGSNSFGGALKNLVDTAVTSMAGMFSSFTSFGARLFGKEGLISNFFHSDAFKSGLNSIKEKLFNEKDGVFKDQVKALKDWGADMWGKTKDQLAKGYDWVYDKYSTYKYGEDYQNNEKWQNSSFMQALNLKAKRQLKASKTLSEMRDNGEDTSLVLEDGRTITFDGRHWKDADGKYIRNSVVEEAKSKVKKSEGKSSTEPLKKGAIAITSTGGSIKYNGKDWENGFGEIVSKDTVDNSFLQDKLYTMSNGDSFQFTNGKMLINGKEMSIEEAEEYRKKNDLLDKSLMARAAYEEKRNAKKSSGATANGKSSVPEIQKAAEETKSSVQEISKETPKVLKESTEKIAEAGTEAAKDLKDSTEQMTDTLVGDTKEKPEVTKKKYAKSFNDTIKKHLPKIGAGAIAGAGLGMLNGLGGASLLGSMFLPTGIIGGAIVGGGLTLLSQTEAFRSLMFGPKGKDGERSGGLISKELKEKFKKAAPIAVGGAVAGALKSIITGPITGGSGLGILGMQLLPGGILGGAIMGMGVGLLKNSETFKSMLFGKKDENGKRTGTWLSKSYESMKQKMSGSSEGLKKALKGGALGAVSGTVLAHMGAIPAALSMGGPIGAGIVGLGLGIASSTKRFNEIMFGVEEFDDNGKSLGRKGGILGRVKNLININVVEPISQSFKSAMLDMIDWTKDKITMPFRTAFGPILDSISGIKDNIVELVSDKFNAIGEGITNMIKKTLSALFSPITKLIGGIGKAMIGGAKVGIKAAALPLTAGLSVMNLLTSGKRFKENWKFTKAYYGKGNISQLLAGYWDAKQNDYNQEAEDYNNDPKNAGKSKKKAKKVGIFEKASDFLSAITGTGELADAAREGWIEGKDEDNRNHFDWRHVGKERRDMRKAAIKRHDAEKQWQKIGKLSRSIGNKDLNGREVTLTESRFKKYKDKFVDAGIDASLINTNEDLMELIYHPEKFRKRAAGDTEQSGLMQALHDYRLTPEELKAMDETKKYQENVDAHFKEVISLFKGLSEEDNFDRATTSYKEDRAKDTKRLKRKLKKAYKSSLWEGRKAIDFDDPELQEYDIEGLTDEDLQDYAASDFADNNDFKGWLASIGRKMSPDDNRMNFVHAKRAFGFGKWTRQSVGKESTEEAPSKSDDQNGATADSQKEIAEDIKKQRELAETQLAITTGGQTNAKKVLNKASSGTLDAKSTSKFSIGGIFNNIFNRKAKADKKAARDAKEAAESAEAQALGDEKKAASSNSEATVNTEGEEKQEKKNGILSKIFGAVGIGLSWAGGTVVGKAIKGAFKIFGPLAIAGGLGLTIAELIKPGISKSIGASITNWNDTLQEQSKDGTLIDNITNRIKGWFDSVGTFIDEKILSKDGYLVQGAYKLGDSLPLIMEKVVIPSINKTADLVSTYAGDFVSAAGTVISAIAPPLAEAVASTIPDIIGAIAKGLYDRMTGKTPDKKGQENLTDTQKKEVTENGGGYRTKTDIVDEAAAQEAIARGQNVYKNSDGTYSVENDYTLDSSQYEDENGNIQTVKNQSIFNRIKGIAAKVGKNIIIGNHSTNFKYGKAAVTGLSTGAGAYLGGAASLFNPLGIIGAAITGGKIGNKVGKKGGSLATKLVDAFKNKAASSTAKKAGAEVAKDTATELVTETGQKLVQNSAGKWVDATTKKFVSQATVDAAKATAETTGKKSTGILAKLGSLFNKNSAKATGAEVAKDAAGEAGEAIAKAAGNKAGTGIEKVAELATQEYTDVIQKSIDACTKITDNESVSTALKKVGKEAGEAGAEEAVKKGFKSAFKSIAEKLGKAMIEVSKKSKIGEKIITLIAGKGSTTGVKSTLAVGTAGIAELGFIAFGGITGAFDSGKVANLFEVSQSMVDWKMRAISSLMNAIFASTVGGFIEIAIAIVEIFSGFDAAKWLASKLYTEISLNSKSRAEKLEKAQDQLKIETALYNQKYGTNMTVSEYNDAANKSWGSKFIGTFTGKNIAGVKEIRNEASEIMESGNYTKDKDGNIKIDQSVGKGAGIVGYGPGPNSQANSAWADMPIGKFSNGKTSTMRTGGCGPTALSTIANMFGNGAINPGTVGMYAARNGFITDGGANEDLFTKGAAGLGLNSTKVYGPGFNEALKSGMPMAISGKNSGPFTKAGHVVVAKGMDKNGNINVIDPIDGNYKKYSKSDITSGMTNAWAYNKPIGYGIVDSAKNIIQNGLSDSAKTMIANNLGLVQNAISNVPQIMQSGMEAAFKIAAKAIVTPVAVPIEYAVKALGTIGKIILNDETLTTEEVQSSKNTSSMLTKMSSSLRKVYNRNSTKVSTSSISTNALKETTNKTSKNNNILTRIWNKLTGKSKKVGNGYGATGNTLLNSGIYMPTLDMPAVTPQQKAMQKAANANNSYVYSYEYTRAANEEAAKALGLSDSAAKEKSIEIADKVWQDKTGQTPEQRKAKEAEKKSDTTSDASSNDSVVLNDTTSSENTQSVWDKTKEILSKAPTTLGGLVSGLKSIGNVMSALWGSIIGEGTFADLLNQKNEASAAGDTVTSSGVTLSADEEKNMIWKYLHEQGYSDAASAAIMGCWQSESSNRARVIEANWIKEFPGYNVVPADRDALNNFVINGVFKRTKGVNKSGYYNSVDGRYYPGIGYAQWTGPRAYSMLQFMSRNNYNWDDPESQIKWFNNEMNNGYSGTKSNMKSATTVTMATRRFFNGYEMGENADTKYPTKYNERLNYAKQIYNLYANKSTGYGNGPVGFGPDDSPSNWAELMQGASTVNNYLGQKLVDMGIIDSASLSSITGNSSESGVSYDPSMWGSGSSAPVDAMRSIYGQLYYSLDGNRQDPDKGTASCASTVAWAYKKALGVRPGDSVSSGAYMSSTQQAKDNRFTTIWTNTGSGLTDDVIKNVLRPGDIVYQNWKQTRNDGNMGHTEMYAGNGKTLSHGGPSYSDKGPVYRDLTSSNRKAHTMMVRRYNGFLKNNTGYGSGPSKDTMKLENEFYKEIQSKNNDHTTRLKQHEGEPTGYGNTATNNNDNVVTRLDKILTVIGEWYMDSKNKKQDTSTTNNTTNTVVNNNSVVKTSTENPKNNNVTTHIDKLAQKHNAYAKMYKSTI